MKALMAMLQSLLEDRFQMKGHREVRETPAYDLVAGKSGPKLSPAKETACPTAGAAAPAGQPDAASPPCGQMRILPSLSKISSSLRAFSVPSMALR